jgi:hypothetical protein
MEILTEAKVSCLFKTAHRTTRALFAEGRAIKTPEFLFLARYLHPLAGLIFLFSRDG